MKRVAIAFIVAVMCICIYSAQATIINLSEFSSDSTPAEFVSQAKTDIILSTTGKAMLGGLEMHGGDLVSYNFETDTSTLLFNADLFFWNENIDAAHALINGNFILSTKSHAFLGGLRFNSGDLIEYNPTTNIATLFFDRDLFAKRENIDAVYVRDNGNIILSTTSRAVLGGLRFGRDDLIEYNPVINTATLFFNGDLFDNSRNIDAVSLLESGHILLSTTGSPIFTTGNPTLGGLSFRDGDVIEYDPLNNTSKLYFDQDLIQRHDKDIDAVTLPIPEPATLLLLGLGGLALLRKRKA